MNVSDQQSGKTSTKEEQRKDLFLRQKQLLDIFLENGAISQAQYDKSLGDLTENMEINR